jgi:hypothetical protein
MKNFIVNVKGNWVEHAYMNGYHAYWTCDTNITAIKLKTKSLEDAYRIVKYDLKLNILNILYILE